MNKPALFNFYVRKEDRTITVERAFNAPLDAVWAAFTEADILCKWWAPKPYVCVIQSLDFREGGRWLYYMEGPQGDRHHCFFDYETVRPKTYYMGHDGFCDERGNATDMIPSTKWENRFSEEEGITVVRMLLTYESELALEKTIEMGFKEGFTMGLEQLEELLAASKHDRPRPNHNP
ncbi:MAG: SRPBCC domain-containing protein [Flavobacteriales bacterium]|nr:SRPBCC domain-containing protein [Flavobacteriales bacterium]